MDIQPGNAQWQGARSEQQDAFGFLGFDRPDLLAHGGVMLVLADGMGGMASGRFASNVAVSRMMDAYAAKTPGESIPHVLERSLRAANQAVYELACSREGEGEVGTTLVAIAVRGPELHWIGVGDSRLYHYRAADDTLTQCTDDHTHANQLKRKVAAGAISAEAAAADPDRNALASFLGLAEIPEIDRNLHPIHLAPGDRLLLCSDGVYGVMQDAEILQHVRCAPQAAGDALLAAVKAKGVPNQDNATAALLGLEEGPAPGAASAAPPAAAPRAGAATSTSGGSNGAPMVLPVFALVILAALGGLYYAWQQQETVRPVGPGQPPSQEQPVAPATSEQPIVADQPGTVEQPLAPVTSEQPVVEDRPGATERPVEPASKATGPGSVAGREAGQPPAQQPQTQVPGPTSSPNGFGPYRTLPPTGDWWQSPWWNDQAPRGFGVHPPFYHDQPRDWAPSPRGEGGAARAPSPTEEITPETSQARGPSAGPSTAPDATPEHTAAEAGTKGPELDGKGNPATPAPAALPTSEDQGASKVPSAGTDAGVKGDTLGRKEVARPWWKLW